MALHQTLKNLCSKTGWCYAVFWKLKRRSRMVLTWEDGYYEFQSLDGDGNTSCLESGSNSFCQGHFGRDVSYSEGQIGLAVAKMSYCVYFMGEGVIGRVAFTGKHQWVFGDGENITLISSLVNAANSSGTIEKHPSSWDIQFAAGIKTIAVIAVPQGVVQLGSTHMVVENLGWVDHVKSVFETLQTSPGAIVSDPTFEGQGDKELGSLPGKSLQNSSLKPSGWFPGKFHQGGGNVQSTGLQAFAQSIIQEPAMAMVKDVDSLYMHAGHGEMGLNRGSLVSHSSMQSSQVYFAAPDVGLSSSMKNEVPFTSQELVNSCSEEVRNTHSENSHGAYSFLNAYGKGMVLEPDASVSMSSYDWTSRNRNTLNFSAGASIPKNGPHRPKGTSIVALGMRSSADLSEFSGNREAASRLNQDVLSLSGVKPHGDTHVSAGSTLDGASQITYSDNRCLKSDTKDSGSYLQCMGNGDMGWDSFENYLASVAKEQSGNCDGFFGFGDELSQALGPAFAPKGRDKQEKILVPSVVNHSKVATRDHSMPGSGAFSEQAAMASWGSNLCKDSLHFTESKPEPLLDAVVASASSSHQSISTTLDDSFSCRTSCGKDGEISVLKAQNEPLFERTDCLSQSFLQGASDCEASVNNQAFRKPCSNLLNYKMSTSCPPLQTILSSWTDDMQSTKANSTTQTFQSKKPEDPSKPTRKRARPGESTRPRPKDRQQIQDRVRELRDIVPNGAKCSIDALLEKTIKHMLFLQNVALHADNLKKNGELKDDVEGGASWALELGVDETGCPPILVKNLNQPRQLLVEMFCEEKGHFLEIADIIRSLGLTILKGVMESLGDKVWARFIVEANKDVRRVDIMMSLMHLLHFNSNSTSSMTVASQTAPFGSQPGLDTSSSRSSSQIQTICGFPQSSLHAQ